MFSPGDAPIKTVRSAPRRSRAQRAALSRAKIPSKAERDAWLASAENW